MEDDSTGVLIMLDRHAMQRNTNSSVSRFSPCAASAHSMGWVALTAGNLCILVSSFPWLTAYRQYRSPTIQCLLEIPSLPHAVFIAALFLVFFLFAFDLSFIHRLFLGHFLRFSMPYDQHDNCKYHHHQHGNLINVDPSYRGSI